MTSRLREVLLVTLAAASFYAAAHISSLPPRVQLPTDLLGAFQPFGQPPRRAVRNTLLLDPVLQFAPWLEFSRAELLAGRLPTWNPGQGLGTVHLANDQSAVFSLWSLPYYLIGPCGLFFAGLGKALALCLGLYCFLRDEGIARRAALAAGLALSASGPVVAWQLHPHTGAFAWVGFALFFAGRVARSEHLLSRWTLGLAAVTAATLTAGHAQLALQVGLVAAVWTLACVSRRARAQGGAAALRGLLQATLGASVGLGLAAIHLLPFAAALGDSVALREHQGAAASVHVPTRLMALGLFPDLFGSPRDGFLDLEVLGAPSYLEQVGPYAGASLLALALLGLCAGTWARRRVLVSTFGCVAAVCLLVVYGPLAEIFARTPPFSLTRNHRLTFLVALSVCVLGAAGLDRVLRRRVPPARAGWVAAVLVGVAYVATRGAPGWSAEGPGRAGRGLAFSIAVPMLGALGALTVAGLRRQLGQRLVGALIGAIVALELLGFAFDFAPGSARGSSPPPVPALAVAKGQRLLAVGARVLPANTGLYYGVHQINHYDALGNARVRPQLERLAPFEGPLMGTLTFDDQVADALSVRWVLTDDPALAQNLRRGLSGWLPSSQGRGGPRVSIPEGGVGQEVLLGVDSISAISLPEVECSQSTLLTLRLEAGSLGLVLAEASARVGPGTSEALFRFPPVFLAGGRATLTVTSAPPGARVLYSEQRGAGGRRLHAGRRALGDLTTLWASAVSAPYDEVASWGERAWLLRNPDARPRASLDGARGAVEITAEAPTEIALAVHTEAPATLTLADAYAPGWEATVNGASVSVDDANGLRAVKVPAGESGVLLVYAPPAVRAGAALSLVSLGLCGLVGVVVQFRRARSRSKRA